MSGDGRSGPLARYRAYASNINNHLGLTAVWALDGTHFDFVAAFHGAVAVAAALAAVRRGSDGVTLDLAQTEAGASVMAPLYLDFLANGREWQAQANEVPGSALSTVVRCRVEDAWLAVELEDLADWQTMCGLLERDDLAVEEPSGIAGRRLSSTPRSPGGRASSLRYRPRVAPRRRTGSRPGAEHRGPVRDPQLRSRDSFVEIDHPDLGGGRVPQCTRPFESVTRAVADGLPGSVNTPPRCSKSGWAWTEPRSGCSNSPAACGNCTSMLSRAREASSWDRTWTG